MPVFSIKDSAVQEKCGQSCWLWPVFRVMMSPFLGWIRLMEGTGRKNMLSNYGRSLTKIFLAVASFGSDDEAMMREWGGCQMWCFVMV